MNNKYELNRIIDGLNDRLEYLKTSQAISLKGSVDHYKDDIKRVNGQIKDYTKLLAMYTITNEQSLNDNMRIRYDELKTRELLHKYFVIAQKLRVLDIYPDHQPRDILDTKRLIIKSIILDRADSDYNKL